MRLRLAALLAGACLVLASSAPARAQDTGALVDAFAARLRAADSATLALEAWCADHRIAAPATITALREPRADVPASAAQRDRLGVGPDAPLRYRKVRLMCGGHVLSEAENWYVPGRLTDAMNAALDGSDAPFGKVIRPLAPTRRTLAERRDWTPAQGEKEPCDANAFTHEALVLDGQGRPLALVVEHYRLELACAAR
jgi:chorismate-pyruvate lyase